MSLLESQLRLARLARTLAEAGAQNSQPDPFATTVVNQTRRLNAVGVTPPPPPYASISSALQRIFQALDFPGQLVLRGLSRIPGLEGIQDPNRFLLMHGVENPTLRGIGDFAIRMVTNPLTFVFPGIAAGKTGAQLAIRASVPFLTRTAELALPGTEAIASPLVAGGQAVARAMEPVIAPISRLFNTMRVPATATPAQAEQLPQVGEAVRGVERFLRGKGPEELRNAIIRTYKASVELTPDEKKLAMLITEQPGLRRFFEQAPAKALSQFERHHNAIMTLADTYRLDRQKAAKLVYRLFPVLQRAHTARQELESIKSALPSSKNKLKKLTTTIKEAGREFSRIFEAEIAGLSKAEQFRYRQFVRDYMRRNSPATLADTPISAVRLAAAAVLHPDLRTSIRSVLQGPLEAGKVLATGEELLKRIDPLVNELKALGDEWHRLETLAGIEYPEVPDYIFHLYNDPPEKVRQVFQQLQAEQENVRRATAQRKSFTKQRTFQTLIDAMLYGLHPNFDPVKVSAVRTLLSVRARALQGMYDKLRELAPKGDVIMRYAGVKGETANQEIGKRLAQGWVKSETLLPNLPGYLLHPEVAHAIRQLDHNVFSDQALQNIFQAVARVTGVIKAYLTARPGQHFRNIIGNTVAMILAGVPAWRIPSLIARARDILTAEGEKLAKIVPGTNMTYEQFLDYFKRSGLPGFGHTVGMYERNMEQLMQQIITEATTGGKPKSKIDALLRLSERLGASIESHFKVGLMLDALDRGMTLDQAARLTRKYLFDYQDLTKFERFLRSSVIPFYVWTRKQLPVLLEAIYTNPSIYLSLGYASQAAHDVTGVTAAETPDWLREQLALPVKVGNQLYFVSPSAIGLPIDPLANIGGALNRESFQKTALEFFGASLNPLVRIPAELATNTKFFSGAPIESRSYQTYNQFGIPLSATEAYLLQQLFSMTPGVSFGAGGPLGLPGVAAENFSSFEPPTPETAVLPPKPQLTTQQKLFRHTMTLLGLSGVGVPVNPERQRLISEMLYAQRLTDLISSLQKDRGVYVPTINDLQRSADPMLTLLNRLRLLRSAP